MDEVIKVGDEVFVRVDGRRAIVTHVPKITCMYYIRDVGSTVEKAVSRHQFIPVKWMDDKVGNTGIGVCAKNGSEG